MTTQPGISALGAPEHCHLELDLEPGCSAADLVRGVAGLTASLARGSGAHCTCPSIDALARSAPPDEDRPGS